MASNKNDQAITDLQERYDALNEKKITAKANLDTSSRILEDLKKQAREQYGTDDLEVLRAKLETMKQENETKRKDYQEHLTAIEDQLAQVEAQHAEAAKKEVQA